jgi:hypothetical protein
VTHLVISTVRPQSITHESIIELCEAKQDELLEKLAQASEEQLRSEGAKPLQEGEFVLLKMEERRHSKDQAPWVGPYEVLGRPDNDPMHPKVIAQHIATKVVGEFNVSMLKRCDLSHLDRIEEAVPLAAQDSFEYVIEAILDHRPQGPRKLRGSKLRPKRDYEFQVLWQDFPRGEENPTWESWEHNRSLRTTEPFKEYCARADIAAQLGADFATEE